MDKDILEKASPTVSLATSNLTYNSVTLNLMYCKVYNLNFSGTAGLGPGGTHDIRPVFTLKSGLKVTGGSGTSEDPYTLGV